MSYVIVEVHTDSVHGTSVQVFDAGFDRHQAEIKRSAMCLGNASLHSSRVTPTTLFTCKVEETL